MNNTHGVRRVEIIKKKATFESISLKLLPDTKKDKRQTDYKKKATYNKGMVSSIHKELCFTNL